MSDALHESKFNKTKEPQDLKVLLLNTEGTIASENTSEGKTATDKSLAKSIKPLPFKYDLKEEAAFREPLDSTDVGPREWRILAETILEASVEREYDAYVISYGTDTMAYAAAGLSFLLQDFAKPIILTGSQNTEDDEKEDALKDTPKKRIFDGRINLTDAMRFAQFVAGKYAGVFVVFGGRVISGTHAVKIDTELLQGFSSIGAPDVGKFASESEGEFKLNSRWDKLFTERCKRNDRYFAEEKPRFTVPQLDPDVLVVQLTPGLRPEILRQAVCGGEQRVSALVVESFGSGGLPAAQNDNGVYIYEYASVLRELVNAGIMVVLGTQVVTKKDAMDRYEVGRRAKHSGVLPQGGLTTEAAVAKLMWLLPQTSDWVARRNLYEEEIAFEKPFVADDDQIGADGNQSRS